ncbi:hypothetical protein TVAG_128840 [Trichomonas vaginalis G3]|uniref:C2 domain-containing protein n=1 Tax=Trichomonas vaginalis (strain ATCC PRA-98 / G3) TaxID=412133 RepID=A2E4D5_TRIV3|nr:C2 domain-containing protein [Trichomonas vaginalis G3]EAY12470.1 hypothetical protein TVAG_128840 [Trichomonas vaginalis G3]KAI5539533.1 C2 domain-containing protein [Trichomonas vaginalis G3]|eukprot:XP_001324693.1 hypothetical protein [Trichomonas vaginalis G3]
MFHNSAEQYQKISGGSPIYIRIDEFNSGSFKIESKNTIVATCGPRSCFRDYPHEFSASQNKPAQAWGFKFINANNSSFTIALYKKRRFFADDLIGEIDLKVSDFELNKVVQKELTLKCWHDEQVPAKIKITVHVDDAGAPAFHPFKAAPQASSAKAQMMSLVSH